MRRAAQAHYAKLAKGFVAFLSFIWQEIKSGFGLLVGQKCTLKTSLMALGKKYLAKNIYITCTDFEVSYWHLYLRKIKHPCFLYSLRRLQTSPIQLCVLHLTAGSLSKLPARQRRVWRHLCILQCLKRLIWWMHTEQSVISHHTAKKYPPIWLAGCFTVCFPLRGSLRR